VGLTTCREFPAMALTAGLILAITVPSIWLFLVLVPIIARSFLQLPLRWLPTFALTSAIHGAST